MVEEQRFHLLVLEPILRSAMAFSRNDAHRSTAGVSALLGTAARPTLREDPLTSILDLHTPWDWHIIRFLANVETRRSTHLISNDGHFCWLVLK